MHKKILRLFYPLLLGIYPALGLVSINIDQMTLSAGVRSILTAMVFSVLMFLLFQWRIRDIYKASLICAWFFLFFYAYGHVYDAIEGWSVSGLLLGRHRFLFPVWLFVFGLGAWWLYKRQMRAEFISRIFNSISVVLVLIPMVQIGLFEIKRGGSAYAVDNPSSTDFTGTTLPSGQFPDVYYIIPDSYSRPDMLKEYYQLDISGFLEQLESMGFYTVLCSQSNYAVTDLSLASSLNLNYIQDVIPVDVENQSQWISLGEPIRHSLVRQLFTDMGYKTVAFETGVWWSEIQDADYFFRQSTHGVGYSPSFWQASEFEILFIRTTVLRVVDELGSAWLGDFFHAPEKGHADYIEYTLDELSHVPGIPGSKFVFVHLMAPHAPFVFSPEGDFVVSETADPGFPNEIEYLNTRLLSLVETIIAQSEVPPIIILQSDHGLDTEVRLANFISIHFPGEGNSVLYPTLTPVNIFRLLFTEYFGQNYPLLPDISYQSAYGDYYNFTEVSYPCNP